MDIEFLYFEDCPSHEDALQRLRDVMQEETVKAEIQIIQVETGMEAQKHRFTGSPTIRINGEDINPLPPETPYNLTCRIYHWADGRISPLPSPEMIRQALHRVR